MKQFKNIIKLFFYVFFLFIFLEFLSIKLFSEYSKNQIFKKITNNESSSFSRVTKSQFQYYKKFNDMWIRSNMNNDIQYSENQNSIWIFGDSVTNGYGLKYTDTYYHNLKNILDTNKKNYNIFATSEYNNNLINVSNLIKKNKFVFKENDILVFQFNYNDILPMSFIKENNFLVKTKRNYFRKIVSKLDTLRFEYFHRSTFIRVLTHYASILSRKTNGTCEERGLDALGQYTYSYGSTKYKTKSIEAWNLFENKLIELNNIAQKNNFKFVVMISPISIQLINHKKLNFHNYSLDCSTIDGRAKILEILNNNQIEYSDPLDLFLETEKIDVKENNFEPLFFEYDTNHPNAKGNLLLSLSLYKSIFNFD